MLLVVLLPHCRQLELLVTPRQPEKDQHLCSRGADRTVVDFLVPRWGTWWGDGEAIQEGRGGEGRRWGKSQAGECAKGRLR